jgi:integrase
MRAAIAYCLNLKFIQVEPWDDIGLLRQYGQLQAFERATNSRRKVVKGGTRAKDEDSGYQELADYLRSTGISVSGPVSGVFPARQGRVGSLRKLPRDWRERIIAATESRIPNLKEAVTSMAANGCRPGEVASTEISTSEGGDLCITVVTLKSPKAPKRGAIFPVNENTKRLVNLAGPPDQPFAPFGHVGAKQLANSLRRISLKVFPDVQPPICPSSFRNQAASDAKQAGATREQIALLLGHTCDEEQKVYGRARYGSSKGGWAPKAVLQSHDVQLNRPLMDFWDQEQPDRNYPSERA